MCRDKICLVTSCTTCLLYTGYKPGTYETVWDHREKHYDLRMKNMSCILVVKEKVNKMTVKIKSNQIKSRKNCGSVLLDVHSWLPMILQLHVGDFDFGCNICGFWGLPTHHGPSVCTTVSSYSPSLSTPSQHLDSNTLYHFRHSMVQDQYDWIGALTSKCTYC